MINGAYAPLVTPEWRICAISGTDALVAQMRHSLYYLFLILFKRVFALYIIML